MCRLDSYTKQKLFENWGDHAFALQRHVEIAFYDPISNWKCYVIALNPDDEDEIFCIIHHYDTITCHWSLQELFEQFNTDGEKMAVDPEFRRIWASTLFNRLKLRL